jgi:SpoVK/Ycf46/Vps4 family AAA+-type ATPase
MRTVVRSLRIHTRMKLDSDAEPEATSRDSHGFVGADIAALYRSHAVHS